MTDVIATTDAPEVPDPAIDGTPLSSYATVLALKAEGIAFAEALAAADIAAERWPAVEAAWREALIRDAAADLVLTEANDHWQERARERVERRMPPLDEDWRVYVDFLRTFGDDADPLAFLAGLRLKIGDVLRLQKHWQKRLEADASLREPFARRFGEPPAPLPEIHPEPPRLRT